jgi:hypothetical protein
MRVGVFSLLIFGLIASRTWLALHYGAIARKHEGEANAAKIQALASARQAEISAHNAIQALNAEGSARREALAAKQFADVRAQAALAAARREADARDAESRARVAATRAKTEALRSAGVALRQRDAVRRLLYLADMNLAQRAWEGNDLARIRDMLAETSDFGERGFEWGYWHRLCHLEALTLSGHASAVSAVAYSPDGMRVALGSSDHTVQVLDARTGKRLLSLNGYTSTLTGGPPGIYFSPDNRRIIARAGDTTVKGWEAQTGKEIFTHSLKVGVSAISCAFSPGWQPVSCRNLNASISHRQRPTLRNTPPKYGIRPLERSCSPSKERQASSSSLRLIQREIASLRPVRPVPSARSPESGMQRTERR